MESEVPLNTLLVFLKLCEESGYIEFRLSFSQIQEKIKSLWKAMSDKSHCTCDVSSDQCESHIPPLQDSYTALANGNDERQLLTTQTPRDNINESASSIESEMYSFLDIKTPEVASTPLPVKTRTMHASPSLSSIDENHSELSTKDSRSEMKEKKVNHGSFIGEECAGGGCEIVTSSSSGCNVRETSQIPLFDLDTNTDDDNDSILTYQSGPCVCVDDHTTSSHIEQSNAESHDVSHGDGIKMKRSHDSHVTISDSSDDESCDDKLEKLFSNMRVQSVKKTQKHIPSRKSLSVFIVSDSEEIDPACCSEEEEEEEVPKENISPRSPQLVSLTTPTYSTPYTPYTGVVFWGSPDCVSPDSKTHHHTERGKTQKPPIRKRNFFTPLLSDNSKLNKKVSVTTPSAGKSFGRFKNNMIQELYTLFNSTVFDNKLPVDLSIIWNKKLRTTAGYCCYLGFGSVRTARIELSTKVIDSYDRMRDTLLHEMCHAATWIIDGIKNGGHGVKWRRWTDKAQAAHPGLKPVERCHHYEIQYKFMYKCTVCDFRIGRHSKSVNLRTARCPYCLSTLELLPKLKSDGTPMVERKMNRYTQFVKDHYSDVKSGSPWRNHKQVMEKIRDLYYSKQN